VRSKNWSSQSRCTKGMSYALSEPWDLCEFIFYSSDIIFFFYKDLYIYLIHKNTNYYWNKRQYMIQFIFISEKWIKIIDDYFHIINIKSNQFKRTLYIYLYIQGAIKIGTHSNINTIRIHISKRAYFYAPPLYSVRFFFFKSCFFFFLNVTNLHYVICIKGVLMKRI
jgi:hypothetical protein